MAKSKWPEWPQWVGNLDGHQYIANAPEDIKEGYYPTAELKRIKRLKAEQADAKEDVKQAVELERSEIMSMLDDLGVEYSTRARTGTLIELLEVAMQAEESE